MPSISPRNKITISDCRHLGHMRQMPEGCDQKVIRALIRRRVPIIPAVTVDVASPVAALHELDDIFTTLSILCLSSGKIFWTGDLAEGSHGINLNACSRGPCKFCLLVSVKGVYVSLIWTCCSTSIPTLIIRPQQYHSRFRQVSLIKAC